MIKKTFFGLITTARYLSLVIIICQILFTINGYLNSVEQYVKDFSLVVGIISVLVSALLVSWLWAVDYKKSSWVALLAIPTLIVYGYFVVAVINLPDFIKYYLGFGN